MSRTPSLAIVLAAVALWACGEPESDEPRDLSLAPAESLATLDDQPQAEPDVPSQPTTQPAPARPQPREPEPPPPPPMLPEGTVLELQAADTVSSATHAAGDPITATATVDIAGADGEILIPAGAVFEGVIETIEGARGPGGQGSLVLAFNQVTFGGNTYSMEARTDTVGTEMHAGGIDAGDAAKVGVGAAAGAIAGGILGGRGGRTEGAIVGGVVGAAAGAGIAVATHGRDIVLPAGGIIRLALAAPMVLEAVNQ